MSFKGFINCCKELTVASTFVGAILSALFAIIKQG